MDEAAATVRTSVQILGGLKNRVHAAATATAAAAANWQRPAARAFHDVSNAYLADLAAVLAALVEVHRKLDGTRGSEHLVQGEEAEPTSMGQGTANDTSYTTESAQQHLVVTWAVMRDELDDLEARLHTSLPRWSEPAQTAYLEAKAIWDAASLHMQQNLQASYTVMSGAGQQRATDDGIGSTTR